MDSILLAVIVGQPPYCGVCQRNFDWSSRIPIHSDQKPLYISYLI